MKVIRLWIALSLLLAGGSFPVPANAQALRASWWDRAPVETSRFYTIKSDLAREETKRWAAHLDRMYEEYARRMANLEPRAPEKLNVMLFASQEEFLFTLRARYGIDGTGSGGMFFVNDRGSGLALWLENLSAQRVAHVVQHEGFHQFAYSRFGADLPVWVNEGLAEFFGQSVLFGSDFVIGQALPETVREVREAIAAGSTVSFRALLGMSPAEWNEYVRLGTASVLYAQSWSMVHFLVYADEARYREPFERYLRLLNDGVPSEAAFVRIFGEDIVAFEKRWRAYASDAQPGAFVSALARLEFLAEGALELARRGESPGTIDLLVERLRQIAFERTVTHHGRAARYSANDGDLTKLTSDHLCRKDPVLALTKPRPRGSSERDRQQEQAMPTPHGILTENLGPFDLRVHWERDRRSGALRYEIRRAG